MITVNSVYLNLITNEKFRILWINPSNTYAYVIDLRSNAKMPYEMLIEDVLKGILRKEITRIDEENIILSDRKLLANNRAWEIIAPLVNQEPDIYLKTERYRLIERIMSEFSVSDVTIYTYLKKYWQGGMTPLALVDQRILSGGKGKEKQQHQKRMGRPSTNNRSIVITNEVKQQIKKVLNDFYFKDESATLKFAYDMMIYLYYSEQVTNDQGVQTIKVKDQIPTMRQFHYWARKLFNPTQKIVKKKGEKNYQRNHRGTEGSAVYEAMAPGTRFEIDSTIGDIYLVSSYRRDKIIGRPTIYMVVDVFSRMITGFYVGLESQSSWFGAMQALIHTAKDKVELCQQYGIEISEEQWPSKYLPRAILADKGEFIGYNSDVLTQNFKIRVENTSSYRADMKGTVEKVLDLIPKFIKPFAPGYIKPDFQERGGKDYRLEAKLTIQEFTSLLIHCILHYNNSHCNQYPLTKAMIEDQVIPTPLNIWSWGIRQNPSHLMSYSTEQVYFRLLPRSKATVTQHGIKFKGALYTCEVASSENWFSVARNQGSWKVDISYDPRDTEHIYIHHENHFIQASLLPHQETYRHTTFEDIDFLNQVLSEQKNKAQAEQINKNVNTIHIIKQTTDEFIKKADSESFETPKSSKSEQIRNIKGNRRYEREIERQQNRLDTKKEQPEPAKGMGQLSNSFKRKSIIELGLNEIRKGDEYEA